MRLRKAIAALTISLTVAGGLCAAVPAKKTTQHKTAYRMPVSTAHRKPVSSAGKKAGVAPRTRTSRAPAKRAPARTWRKGQMAPTPDRYKEIQQALVDKGYLRGEATGKWDQDSADALRRFQHDQSLEPSGKLTSLSIIALGLGHKDEAPQAKPPVPPPAPPLSQP